MLRTVCDCTALRHGRGGLGSLERGKSKFAESLFIFLPGNVALFSNSTASAVVMRTTSAVSRDAEAHLQAIAGHGGVGALEGLPWEKTVIVWGCWPHARELDTPPESNRAPSAGHWHFKE